MFFVKEFGKLTSVDCRFAQRSEANNNIVATVAYLLASTMSSSGSDDGESGDDSSESSSDEEIDDISVMLRRVKENSFLTTTLHVGDEHSEWVQNNMTDEEWEELGRDVSNNCCLEELDINDTLSD